MRRPHGLATEQRVPRWTAAVTVAMLRVKMVVARLEMSDINMTVASKGLDDGNWGGGDATSLAERARDARHVQGDQDGAAGGQAFEGQAAQGSRLDYAFSGSRNKWLCHRGAALVWFQASTMSEQDVLVPRGVHHPRFCAANA